MEVLVWVVVPCWTCGGDVGEVFQNLAFENRDIHGIGGLCYKGIDVPLIIVQCSLPDFLCPLERMEFSCGTAQCTFFNYSFHSHGDLSFLARP